MVKPVAEVRKNQKRLQEQDIDLANIGPAWTRLTQGSNVMEEPARVNVSERDQQTAQWAKTAETEQRLEAMGDLCKRAKFQRHMCTVNRLGIRTKHSTSIQASSHVFPHRPASSYVFSYKLTSSYRFPLKLNLDFIIYGFHGFLSISPDTML